MDALNNRSSKCSNTFNNNEALAKVIVEDDELYEELRRRLRASKMRTNMGVGEALNSTIMRSMEQCVYMKYPELEKELSRQEGQSIQGSYCPASGGQQPGGLAAVIASSFQCLLVRIGNENRNTNKNTDSLGSGQGTTRAESAFGGRRGSLTQQTTSMPITARKRAAPTSSRRRGSLTGSFLGAFFIVEYVEVEEEQPSLKIDPRGLNSKVAASYVVPSPSSSSLPRKEVSERLDASSSSLVNQSSRVTSTASQIISGACSMMHRASLCDTDGGIQQQGGAAITRMEQHAEASSETPTVLVASEVDRTTSACYFGAWDNDEDCTCKRLY
jgi:hypothetical protein